MSLGLQHALEALYGLERRRDKHDLLGITALLDALGNPHRRFRSVHVAGTNGKGSVCALIERVLREAGFRTGLFTSPHLVDFRERIRVNGRWADERWLERMLERIASLPEGKDRTFFEVCTALAFQYFAELEVEIAVVEAGLGGRLDCTNVLSPLVSGITTIGFDHTEILGDTLEQIAFEKAGIIKPGVPVVVGRVAPPAARVIHERALEMGAPVPAARFQIVSENPEDGTTSIAPECWPEGGPARGWDHCWLAGLPWAGRPVPPAAHPSFQPYNRGIALGALAALVNRGIEIPWPAVVRGFPLARWPGRFERCRNEPRLRWDGAHNVQAMMALLSGWRDLPGDDIGPPGALVLAVSAEKDLPGILQVLGWDFRHARLFAARSRHERAMPGAAIAEQARAAGFDAVDAGGVVSAVRDALAFAGKAPVLLTGSLFAVGEAMEAFGGAPGEML
ncbi:MAG: bifunctional folylpolyglutamate synthase/dihydrofolate synthase [Candidatus Eiseniibacteriota bacterium]